MIDFEKCRSYRRFDQQVEISEPELIEMVNAARLSPSSRNIQPIKFFINCNRNINELIFQNVTWAGYLPEWDGPPEGEKPSGYIVLLHDTSISETYSCDHGIFAQSIMLKACEMGYGGCIIGAIKKEAISQTLNIPNHLKIILIIAIGKPVEKVIIEDMRNRDYKYWRDDQAVHHVPKRRLDELIINTTLDDIQ